MGLKTDALRLRKIRIERFGIFVIQATRTIEGQEHVITGSDAIDFKFSLERAAHSDQISRAARLHQQHDYWHHVIDRYYDAAHARRVVSDCDFDRLWLRSLRHSKVLTKQVDASTAQRLYVPRSRWSIGLNRIYAGSNALEAVRLAWRPPIARPRKSRRPY